MSTIFGSIPGFQGVWANTPTEGECRTELHEVLEGWILLGIANHDDLSGLTKEDAGAEVATQLPAQSRS